MSNNQARRPRPPKGARPPQGGGRPGPGPRPGGGAPVVNRKKPERPAPNQGRPPKRDGRPGRKMNSEDKQKYIKSAIFLAVLIVLVVIAQMNGFDLLGNLPIIGPALSGS